MGEEGIKFELFGVEMLFEDFKIFREHSSGAGKGRLLRWKILGILYCLIFVFMFFIAGHSVGILHVTFDFDTIKIIFLNFLMFMGVVVYPWFLHPLINKAMLKKIYITNKLDERIYNYSFTDLEFSATSKNGINWYKWDEIDKIKETKDQICIYISKVNAFIIPKRYMEGNSDLLIFLHTKL